MLQFYFMTLNQINQLTKMDFNHRVDQRFESYVKPSVFPFFTVDQLNEMIRNLENSLVERFDKLIH